MRKPSNSIDYKTMIALGIVAVLILAVILYLVSNSQNTLNVLMLTIGWMLCMFVGLAGLTVLWQIWIGKIDMANLFSEGPDGKASFSRFQFFIFTFVIAMSLFLVTVGGGPTKDASGKEIPGVPAFPKIPTEILMLLGISSASYLVSKGMPGKEGGEGAPTDPAVPPAGTPADPKAKLAKVEFLLNTRLKPLGEEQAADDPKTKELRATLKQLLESAQGA